MAVLLVVIAVLTAIFGAASLSQATMGVGIICIGCFIAILARIVQASVQHNELLKKTN
jgi:hypothetical protein